MFPRSRVGKGNLKKETVGWEGVWRDGWKGERDPEVQITSYKSAAQESSQ